MKTSIFTKLLSTYLVIVLITLLVVGFFSVQLFENYFYNERQRDLVLSGQEIASIYTGYLLGLQETGATQDLLFLLDRFLEAKVTPVSRQELLLACCPGFIEDSLTLTEQELEEVLTGKTVSKRAYFPEKQAQWVTVAVPMTVLGEVIGAVFLNAPLTGIAATVNQVRMFIFYAGMAAVFLSALVGLYMSKSISHPLQLMNRAALEVAGGNYQQQVEVYSNDEVGQLAQTFNYMSLTLQQTVEALSREKTKLENVMLGMSEGVIAVDDQGKIILTNPQARRLLQLEQDDLQGLSLTEVIAYRDFLAVFQKALENRSREKGEITLKNNRIISINASPLRTPDKAWGVVGVIQDVTEVRRLEQTRRDFVANVSHELRTPMTSIQGFVEALLDGMARDKEEQDRYLNVILDETVRLNRLVNDLLDLSGLEMGKYEFQKEPVSISEMFRQAVDKLQVQVKRQNLQVIIKDAERIPPVLASRDRLQQVLINLLSNAVSFTPEGGRIELSAEVAGQAVKVKVTDNGPGIPWEEQDKVWERFHKVDKARTRGLGGTGLGLAIVRQIIEAHGGEVGLVSTPGEGSTFWFTLPAAG